MSSSLEVVIVLGMLLMSKVLFSTELHLNFDMNSL